MSQYRNLTLLQKRKMIAELQDAIEKSDQIFYWAEEVIQAAKFAKIIKDATIINDIFIPENLIKCDNY